MIRMRPGLFALPLLLAATPRAQTPQAAAAARFVLEPGEHDLRQVLETAGRFLGRNYLVGAHELPDQVKVNLTTRIDVDAAGCESTVANLAYTQSIVLTPLDRERGLWEALSMNGPRRSDICARAIAVTAEELAKLRKVPIWVTTTVWLRHARASEVAQMLRPFLAGGRGAVNLGTVGNEGMILVSGLATDVGHAADLIAEADRPAPLPKVEEDRLASLERRVRELEAKVQELSAAPAKSPGAPEWAPAASGK